jgi:hypothetical protein
MSVLEEIKSQEPPGRFLQHNGITGTWREMNERQALAKIMQALRENGVARATRHQKESKSSHTTQSSVNLEVPRETMKGQRPQGNKTPSKTQSLEGTHAEDEKYLPHKESSRERKRKRRSSKKDHPAETGAGDCKSGGKHPTAIKSSITSTTGRGAGLDEYQIEGTTPSKPDNSKHLDRHITHGTNGETGLTDDESTCESAMKSLGSINGINDSSPISDLENSGFFDDLLMLDSDL